MDFVAFREFERGSFHGDRATARDALVFLVSIFCQQISIELELKRLT